MQNSIFGQPLFQIIGSGAANFTGSYGTFTFSWEDCKLRVHDGVTCGGKVINLDIPQDMVRSDEEIKAIALQCILDNAQPTLTSATVDDDTITLTLSDGTPLVITTDDADTPESDGLHINGAIAPVVDVAAETITYETVNDADENSGPPIVADISALIAALTSPAAPTFVGNGVTFNPVTNTYTITDVDTAGTFNAATNTISFPDGTSLLIPPGATPSSLVDNEDGTFTHNNGVSDPVIVDYKTEYSDASLIYADLDAYQAATANAMVGCPIGGKVILPVVAGTTVAIPDGTQQGDRLNLFMGGLAEYDRMFLTGNFRGIGRNINSQAIERIEDNDEVRTAEHRQYIWDGNNWCIVASNPRNFHGGTLATRWRENDDGFATLIFPVTFPVGNNGIIQEFALPVAVTNPVRLETQVTDLTNDSTTPVGTDLLANVANFRSIAVSDYASFVQQNTAVTIALAHRLGANDANAAAIQGPRRVSVHTDNARLDYAAL